jgi:hypothetical protein
MYGVQMDHILVMRKMWNSMEIQVAPHPILLLCYFLIYIYRQILVAMTLISFYRKISYFIYESATNIFRRGNS